MNKKQQDLVNLASKGGKDAELMLLDLIHELEDKLAQFEGQLVSDLPIDAKVDRVATRLAAKMSALEKGDPGETPTEEQLLALMRPLIPNVQDGKTPTKDELRALIKPLIPPPLKGEPGDDATVDENAIVKQVLKQVPAPDLTELQEEIATLRKDLETRQPVPDFQRTIFGPGKTRIIRIDLSSQLDGSTKTFTLGTHFGIVDVQSSSAPFTFRETIDYKESGKKIAFQAGIDAPTQLATGQTLIVKVLR